MKDEPQRAVPATPFERRVGAAVMLAAPALVAVGAVCAAIWPEIMGESDTATGAGLWIGALFGLAMFTVLAALPQLLFGLALRSGRRGPLTATAIGAPVWALFFGILPLIGAFLEGWEGVAPPAVIASAIVAVLDVFVTVVAVRCLGRLPARPRPEVGP